MYGTYILSFDATMKKTLVCFLLVACLSSRCAYSQTDYCRICANHTLCIYPDSPAPRCNQLISSGATQADINTIVNTHNFYRARVASGSETRGNPGPQPSASNMQRMVWDTEVANVARVWSKQCNVATDACRNVPRFRVGQNVYWTACSGGSLCNATVNWREAVDAWYDGVRNMDNGNVDPFVFTSDAGTYTQVVWGKSGTVGCSCAVYRTTNGWINKLYVCDYGPAGNVFGSRVYLIGPPCSACTTCSPNGVLCI